MGRPVHDPPASPRRVQEPPSAGTRAALNDATLAADASLRSLSSLLLAARASSLHNALDHRPPLPAPPLARQPAPALRPPAPAPAPPAPPTWRSLASHPPPLVGDDSDSEDDGDLPDLLDSPRSQSTGFDDLFCPWATAVNNQRMQDTLPQHHARSSLGMLRRAPMAFNTFGGGTATRPGATRGGSAGVPSSSSAAVALPLEEELLALAGKVAELVRVHQDRLGRAPPRLRTGMQDVANQLHSLAAMLQAGPPPLI